MIIDEYSMKIILNNLPFDKIKLLSKRENELLSLIVIGFTTNKEISSKLCISEYTVKNHLSNIFKKIECADRTQAAIFCVCSILMNISEG